MTNTINPLVNPQRHAIAGNDKVNARSQDKAADTTAQEKVTLKGEQAESLTYDKPTRVIPPDLQAMLAESQKNAESMINLVRNLVEEQGLDFTMVVRGEQKLTTDQASIDAAKAAISEDGEWGVRKVAERILSFAKFAIGDDPNNLAKIREAVQVGFDEAREILGGELPEISQQTYDTIMAEFDRWEKEGIPAGDTVSLKKSEAAASAATSDVK
ncbi:hypothetical protein [Chitinibacter sp. S2-10]|uniref:hypothetical protein n=1 Tax=Chitinibacter sp. S2-10 TaxID=3373597 RepID=UPI00397729FE